VVTEPPEVVPSVIVSEAVDVIDGDVLSKLKLPLSTLWLVETLLVVVTLVELMVSEASIAKPIALSL
jgi:hypothetical protein